MGRATTMAPRLIHKVPMMHGRIPPYVMESIGGCVRKVQFMALQPFETRKTMTISNAIPLMAAESLNRVNIRT